MNTTIRVSQEVEHTEAVTRRKGLTTKTDGELKCADTASDGDAEIGRFSEVESGSRQSSASLSV